MAHRRKGKPALEQSVRLAAGVTHKVLHALQFDLEEEFGFGVYRFRDERGYLVADDQDSNSSELWSFRGMITGPTNFIRFYEVVVRIKHPDAGNEEIRWEKYVSLELLNPDNGGVEYKFYVPALGEHGHVRVESRETFDIPVIEEGEDILAGIDELNIRDHLGAEETPDV